MTSILLCAALLVGVSLAQEQQFEDAPQLNPQAAGRGRAFLHPLTDMPDASPDISTAFYFPDNQDLKFPIGETLTVLCHFRNNGDRPYNATAIMGSINLPFDFSQHVYNFTYEPVGTIVSPNDEFTFEYQFWLHPNLQPAEYAIAHTVFYDDGMSGFSSTFFNQTVELYTPEEGVGFGDSLRLIFFLASTVFVGGLFYFLVFKEELPTLKKTTRNAQDDSWVQPRK